MRILFIFGTRPEAIKMAPLIKIFKNNSAFDSSVCVTGQHREMLDDVSSFFKIKHDYDLRLMQKNQSLSNLSARIITSMESVLEELKPDNIFVQGDTTTVFCSALAAFYKKISISHLEAGLRSYNKYSPFPEEINRCLTGHIADYHFAPTPKAVTNLKSEGIIDNVWLVGNTVIDALHLGLNIIKDQGEEQYYNFFNYLDFSKRIILVTGHRRESFGKPFENICNAIKHIADNYQDVEFVYPVHLNPNVRKTVNPILQGIDNIHLVSPLKYPYLIWLMSRSFLVLTDSGGIQEEAPSLGKPVIVLRDVTERQEGVDAGTAALVGTSYDSIVTKTMQLLDSESDYANMANSVNPYGDGTTSQQILSIFSNIIKSGALS